MEPALPALPRGDFRLVLRSIIFITKSKLRGDIHNPAARFEAKVPA